MKYLSFFTNWKSFFHWKVFLNLLFALGFVVLVIFGLLKYLDVYTHHDEKIQVPTNIMKLNLFDVKTALDKANLKYEIDTFKYDTLYKPFAIIDVYPKPGAFVKKGRRIFIRANPRTWRPVEVPNLIDVSKYLAFTKLNIVGLNLGDTIYIPYKYTDIVVEMRYKGKKIKPGTLVPRFSKIDLVIGEGLKPNVIMPSLIGLTYEEAKKVLKENFYELGLKQFTRFRDSAEARVYYQSPLAGDISDQGMMVDIWLSEAAPDSLYKEIRRLDNIYNKSLIIDSSGRFRDKINLSQETNDAKPTGKNPNQISTKPKSKPKPKPKSEIPTATP